MFPASQLGNENQINEGLGLGTVDIIYTGTSFAGSIHKPLAITGAPFMLRDFDHWKAYRDSKLFRDLAKGYEDKTKHKIDRAHLLRPAHGDGQQGDQEARGHEGHEAARARRRRCYLMFTKSVGANATPIAFAEVYLALQQGTVDGQENPLPTIMAKKFYEVQSHIMLTGHITESLLTIVGSARVGQADDDEKKIFEEVLMQAAAKATDADPRLRAEARRRVQEARQERGRGGPRGVPRGGAAAAQRRQPAAGARRNTTRCRR